MSAAVRQGTIVIVLVLKAVRVELLVAVGASSQGVQGGAGAATRDRSGAGGAVLPEAWRGRERGSNSPCFKIEIPYPVATLIGKQ